MAFTLLEPTQLLEEIKKSRFLTYAAPVTTAEQAADFITHVSDPTATHNCWAWKIAQQYRFNDAGEPAGTAGRPILSAIEGQQCDQVVMVVIRWFGGIKLGTGGLARAYGGGASRCLQQASLIEIIPRIQCQFHCYYGEWPLLESRLANLDAIIEQQDFDAEGVSIRLALPKERLTILQQWLADTTRGRVQARAVETN